MHALRINDGVIIGIPMEPFADYALRIAWTAGSDRVFFNGYIGYLPTAAEIPYGGYEIEWMPVIYGLGTGYLMPVQPRAEGLILGQAMTSKRLISGLE
ncbi:MAG: hypothetical protein K8J31_19905 [Anaerolineae bacterium]|nr:hypothetical protein [Anaerolineae bacterium]